MKFLKIALFSLGFGFLCGCAANAGVLAPQCTAPTQDNDGGSCAAPVLIGRAPNDSMWVHFKWNGPVSGEDSVRVAPGGLAKLPPQTVPPGSYLVQAWPSDAFSTSTCVVAITKVVRPTIWKVGGLQ